MSNPEIETPKPFDWTLHKDVTKTIFAKKKMEEFTEIKKVFGFIKQKMGITYQGESRYKFLQFKTELNQMEEFRNLYDKKHKSFSIAYTLSKHKWGRIQPVNNLSLSIMHRPTRHGLCDGVYRDIDMVNAQPTAVLEIAKKNGIAEDLPTLQKYVDDPKKYRAIIAEHHNCDKDTAKRLPICLMMGGSYSGWLKDNDIQMNRNEQELLGDMKNLETEMKLVMNIVYLHNKHIQKDVLRQDPTKWKNENECKRGVMGLWSQTVERLFQEAVVNFLVESKGFKIEHIVPCQDGFMILKDLWYEGITQDCDTTVKSTYGIDIKFIEKPFDEKIEIPLFEGGKTAFEWNDTISAKLLAERLLKEFGDCIIKYKSKVFVYYENKWYDETDSKQQHKLSRYISENLYDLVFKDIADDISLDDKFRGMLLMNLRDNTCKLSRMSDIIKHTLSSALLMKEDFNSKPFLLGFDNGVFDLETNTFRDYQYDDYMTMSVNYDYAKPNYEDEEVLKLREELITMIETIHPDPDIRQLYIQVLASGLDGRAYQKLFLFNGQGGNGKGLTGKLMKLILGDYYHQPTNAILSEDEKSNTPSPDIANLKNKRYLNFAEVEGSLKVTIIKKLSGGDQFTGRFLNQNPETFDPTWTNVLEFNEAPAFEGAGDATMASFVRRALDIQFATNCVAKGDDRIGTTVSGITYIEANSKYETPQYLKSVRLIFLDILLGAYANYRDPNGNGMVFTVPESVTLRTQNFLENQNIFKTLFNKIWIKVDVNHSNIMDVEEKTLRLKDMWQMLASSEAYKLLSYREKRKYCKERFYEWIAKQTKVTESKQMGKSITGWVVNPENVFQMAF